MNNGKMQHASVSKIFAVEMCRTLTFGTFTVGKGRTNMPRESVFDSSVSSC